MDSFKFRMSDASLSNPVPLPSPSLANSSLVVSLFPTLAVLSFLRFSCSPVRPLSSARDGVPKYGAPNAVAPFASWAPLYRGVQDPSASVGSVIVSRSESSSPFCRSALVLGFLALFEGARCRFGVTGAVALRVAGIFQSGAAEASARQARQAR